MRPRSSTLRGLKEGFVQLPWVDDPWFVGQAAGIEAPDPVTWPRWDRFLGPAARSDENAHELPGIDTLGSQRRQLDRAVALGQAAAIRRDGQGNVAEGRGRETKSLIEQELPRSAGHQIVAADDLGHAHEGVIDDHGKLVRRAQAVAADDEISAQPRGLSLLGAAKKVVPADDSRRNPEPPGERTPRESKIMYIAHLPMGAGTGVGGAFVFRMGRAGGAGDVGPSAGAWIDEFTRFQPLQGFVVQGFSPGLNDGFSVPIKAQPFQVDQSGCGGLVANPGSVQILDAQKNLPAIMSRGQPGDQERPGMADVQPSRG